MPVLQAPHCFVQAHDASSNSHILYCCFFMSTRERERFILARTVHSENRNLSQFIGRVHVKRSSRAEKQHPHSTKPDYPSIARDQLPTSTPLGSSGLPLSETLRVSSQTTATSSTTNVPTSVAPSSGRALLPSASLPLNLPANVQHRPSTTTTSTQRRNVSDMKLPHLVSLLLTQQAEEERTRSEGLIRAYHQQEAEIDS